MSAPDEEAFRAWRASVTEKLRGRSFDDTLVSFVAGLPVPPLSIAGTAPATLAARPGRARTGAVLREGEAAPDGPDVAWWVGAPGSPSSTTRLAVVEGDAPQSSAFEPAIVLGSGRAAAIAAHERGAEAPTEIAAALWVALSSLPSERPTAIGVAVGPDVLVEIAKLRALRAGLAALSARAGAPMPSLCARTSFRLTSRLDVEANAIRTALASFAALAGGADVVCALPYDAAEPVPSERGARLAWTGAAVLARECALDGPGDLAHGAHHVEELTRAFGRAAWQIVREIEAGGSLEERIVREAAEHTREIRTRKRTLVGTSRFPRAGSAIPVGAAFEPFEGRRDAAPFEELARKGEGREATLVSVGSDRSVDQRAGFVAELSSIAALRLGRRGPFEGVEAALPACAASSPLALVATTDAIVAEGAAAIVRALRDGGAREVLVAGKPGSAEGSLRDAGATGFLHSGGDVVAALGSALDEAYGART